ncbi:MAG: type II toxin-antitoxin system VapC family toxin [Acidimicrobiia bacterium]|nr:type II toxin-antitoxin system VapC family toxin [Acidimicrobiia bacterium]MYC57416.1 type II toxin-antitoxin system VapC family toxin [Acidimicrobiia bacterium]MYG94613.1 type II toxin-antitoxin system VapC family toxin [Acidimicrobiia bacterium]MYI30254.1 type II toxin-antitoxin system VapC family toxin [Acidimicrobiia bacterium]
MNLLLDTHVFLWWSGERRIATQAFTAISNPDNIVYVSAASIWEIGIKRTRGKLEVDDAIFDVRTDDFEPLPITHVDARLAGCLPDYHRDPFDRMLVAQALTHDLMLVTRDPKIQLYEVEILVA